MNKVLTIIQARMSSTRLPRKALLPIAGKPMIQWVVEAAPEPKVVAVPNELASLELVKVLAHMDVDVYIPPPSVKTDDVLGRFAGYIEERDTSAEYILRLTGDCPMITPSMVTSFMSFFKDDEYTIYTNRPLYMDGYDMEVFSVSALMAANASATDPYDREHVTPWMYRVLDVKRARAINQPYEQSPGKRSIDTAEDYDRVRKLMEERQHEVS